MSKKEEAVKLIIIYISVKLYSVKSPEIQHDIPQNKKERQVQCILRILTNE